MRLAIVTDTHFGARGESRIFFEGAARFFTEQFFPYLRVNGIDHIVHLGYLVDRHKYVAYTTANVLRTCLVDPIVQAGMRMEIIPGNHDIPFRKSVRINAERELMTGTPGVTIHDRVGRVEIGGRRLLMLPWICEENTYDVTGAMLGLSRDDVVCAHLELAGFATSPGVNAKHGGDKAAFAKAGLVLTGHYHHKSSQGNVHYLGSPYEMTWTDYDDPKGFHVLDTDTLELTFVQNPSRVHEKVHYSDGDGAFDLGDPSRFRDKIVKVIVREKRDPVLYDRTITALEQSGAARITVADDHLRMNVFDVEVNAAASMSTAAILEQSVDEAEGVADKEELKRLLGDLYAEAIAQERVGA